MAIQFEYVVLVDDEDRVIGQAEKMAAHEQGLLHRAFSVFLLRKQAHTTQTLLQRRAMHKYHGAGLWTNTCCSHPRPGETVEAAAQRRLAEEMGIQAEPAVIGHFQYRAEFANGLIEHEFDYVLVAWDQDPTFNPNPEEVMDARWVALDQLALEYVQDPVQFTPWFKQALELVARLKA